MDSPSIGIYAPDWKLTRPIEKKDSFMKSMRIGLDLAKNIFEAFAVNHQEQPLFRKTLKCNKVWGSLLSWSRAWSVYIAVAEPTTGRGSCASLDARYG